MEVLRRLLPATLCQGWRSLWHPDDTAARPAPQWPGALAADVLQAVARSAAVTRLEAAIGPAPWCNLAQSWARRGRPPHSWHQDGALHHDFMAHIGQPAPADALLPMRTLWLALTPCGVDAPGLEWVNAALHRLLSPHELADEAVRQRFGGACIEHAQLQPGDALIFDGSLLHRTHLTAAMTQPRLSLELRFFRAHALPQRVAGEAGQRLY